MDWDLKEPTPAQVSYAALISRKLNIPIPSEAEKYRFHMALFIDAYSEQYRSEMSKPPTSNAVEMEKAQALVAKKLRSPTSGDSDPC